MSTGDAARLTAIGASVNAFAQSAAAGHFAVNETGGQALLSAIRRLAGWIEEQRASLVRLEQEPLLGGSNSAKVMRPYVQQVASDPQGFVTQLMALYDSLGKADKAICSAMANYHDVDNTMASRLGSEEGL
ncbi:hypothetical protein [Actinokineospora bangkokensis]|uniref:PE domain-containing protein n=1 Tax=Actinokineospora bangkokensis TaxID=1193682 RepID=A0A1Q9LDW7_9PSEU|nr:hypothetical protein [Actinokineospora bangkokensis]OLR90206.1 hypothetical protein BJP25_04415 [Actinokineospora bangkokensis]